MKLYFEGSCEKKTLFNKILKCKLELISISLTRISSPGQKEKKLEVEKMVAYFKEFLHLGKFIRQQPFCTGV